MREIELVNLRTTREKHFLQEDGTIVAKYYSDDIHYKDGNKYLDIDNKLIKSKNVYKNKANSFIVLFNTIDNKEFFTINIGKHYIKFYLKNGNFSNSKKKNNTIKYENVLKDIDIEYSVISNKIKEKIIVNNKNAIKESIEFKIETDFRLTIEDNRIICKSDDYLFSIESPIVITKEKSYYGKVKYVLDINEDNYVLKYILDNEWFEKATYPLIIDPTITNITNENSVYDTYIFPGDTNISRYNQDILKVGVEKVNNQDVVNRSLLKFDLPTIGTGSQIIEASLDLIGYGYFVRVEDSEIINVHQITSNWSESTANWNNMNNNYNPRIEGYVHNEFSLIDYNYSLIVSYNIVDITNLVKKWYANVPNYGIMLIANEEVYKSSKVPAFYSKDNGVTGNSPKPLLIIKYRNQNGLEDYMDYLEQQFSKGNSYFNTYNGNMTFNLNLVSTIGGAFPANLMLVYNTNDVILNNNYGLGKGYKHNYYQTIKKVNIDSYDYLEYLDADGTLHYFVEDTEQQNHYYDEDGLNMTIEDLTTKYVLKDKNGNKIEFNIDNYVGYLSKITDTNDNDIIVNYDSSHKITSIIDSSNNEIDITYSTNQISVVSSGETITINYTNGAISSVVYKIGTISITYNNDLIEYILDITGLKIKYEYYEQLPYRIKKIIQYGLNNEIGQYFDVSYGYNATTIKDNQDKIIVKTYNNLGNLVSTGCFKDLNILNDAYGMISEYGQDIINGTQYKNKLLSSQIPLKYVNNYIIDSSFEYSNTNFYAEGASLVYSNDARTGYKSLMMDSNIQCVKCSMNVPKGKYYTFSIYSKNNCNMQLDLSYRVSSDPNLGMWVQYGEHNDWERESVTLFYPEEAITDLELSITKRSSGIAYIDDIQLEEGEVANNYNMIDDSNFTNGIGNWTLSATNKETEQAIPTNTIFEVVSVDQNNNKALKVNMNPNHSSYIEKTYNVSGKMGDVYNISFWYKNEGLYASGLVGDPICNIVTILYEYIENGIVEGQCTYQGSPFNVNDQNWQFYSASFIALDDFNSFKLRFYQDANANCIYITNMSLIKDVREVNYDYDDSGNLLCISGLDNEEMNYNYDSNNQLIKMTEPKGANFHYEYDNDVNDRILNGLSGTGISNMIKYDSFGNPVQTKIEHKNNDTINDGLYRIRLKGTEKYLRLINNQLVVQDDDYGHDVWNIEIDNDYYKINHNIINNKFISVIGNIIVANAFSNDTSLFELTRNDNGSYLINLKQENIETDKQYIKFDDNYNLSVDVLVLDDYHYEFYIETINDKKFIENNSIYTSDGKFIQSTIGSLLYKSIYDIDSSTGLIDSIIDDIGNETSYTYDNQDRITSTTYNNKTINYSYNNSNLISKIYNSCIEYNITYDNFLNVEQVKIGNNITLVTNSYGENNGNLLNITYGNNDEIDYTYDDFNRVKTVSKFDVIYRYLYDGNGNLSKILSDDDYIEYTFGLSQMLSRYRYHNRIDYKDLIINYSYDKNSNITNRDYSFNNLTLNVENTFNDDNSIIQTNFDNNTLNYTYDSLGRLINKSINNNYNTLYDYLSLGHRTSTILKSINNNNDKYLYKYNRLKNITHIYHNSVLENEYCYDIYSQLIEEKNYIDSKKAVYTYDSNGNILTKKEYDLNTNNLILQNTYEYNNSNWCDQLTKYNNFNITYDSIGNPLTIGNYYFVWVNGRQLNGIGDSNGPDSIVFKYNAMGVRTSKTFNNVETTYYTEGTSVIFEKTNNNVIQYIWNDIDHVIGLKYNNQTYYYIKNAQDDIIGILDSNNDIVAKYRYDSWGNILSITDNNNQPISNLNHIAHINPYRYRSYYYDKETNLYYLNTRYYSPMLGRFLNPDGIVGANRDILSYNLYSYCSNNYIKCNDKHGSSFGSVISKVISKVVNIIRETIKIEYIRNKYLSNIKKSNNLSKANYEKYKYTPKTTTKAKNNESKNYCPATSPFPNKTGFEFEFDSGIGIKGESFDAGYNFIIKTDKNGTRCYHNFGVSISDSFIYGISENYRQEVDCNTGEKIGTAFLTYDEHFLIFYLSDGDFSVLLGGQVDLGPFSITSGYRINDR